MSFYTGAPMGVKDIETVEGGVAVIFDNNERKELAIAGGDGGAQLPLEAVVSITALAGAISVEYSSGAVEVIDVPQMEALNVNPVVDIIPTGTSVRTVYANNTTKDTAFMQDTLTSNQLNQLRGMPEYMNLITGVGSPTPGEIEFTHFNGQVSKTITPFVYDVTLDTATGLLTYYRLSGGNVVIDLGAFIRDIIEEIQAEA